MKANQRNMMMLMLHTTWRNVQFKYPEFQHFRRVIAYHAGYTEGLTLLNGERITVPRSFTTMTSEEYRLVYPAMRAICERILHDLALYDIEERVHEMAA